MDQFLADVMQGLNAHPKYLQSKYFYDAKGDAIFREIMASPEYYLTRCELEIFKTHSVEIARMLDTGQAGFDLVELGPGDAFKSVYLLSALVEEGVAFTYFPIDISPNVIDELAHTLPQKLPGLAVHGLKGDYLQMMHEMGALSRRKKVVLFLGSNVGNFTPENTGAFLNELRSLMNIGDLLLVGFDLKKDPGTILAAYNDRGGVTRRFNLNLLQRINESFDADFNVAAFEHKPVYDDETGACRSFLVSREEQDVHIGDAGCIHFNAGEQVFMEISQKYTVEQTDTFAIHSRFRVLRHFFDQNNWFLDALWECM